MTAQTKGVNVLAVMARDSSHACEHRITKSVFDSTRQKMASESVEARAALAELIDTAKKLHIVTAGMSPDIDANERAALMAALARCGGA